MVSDWDDFYRLLLLLAPFSFLALVLLSVLLGLLLGLLHQIMRDLLHLSQDLRPAPWLLLLLLLLLLLCHGGRKFALPLACRSQCYIIRVKGTCAIYTDDTSDASADAAYEVQNLSTLVGCDDRPPVGLRQPVPSLACTR